MINVNIIQDSINRSGRRITTFELEYPRFIHAELMTHRVFSRNAASSRAIPIEKMIALVEASPATPIWTMNKAGMQGDYVTDHNIFEMADSTWIAARNATIECVKALSAMGIHKQNANRLLEPFQHIKVVLTATCFENFFALRCHPDAQPEIQMLANYMREALRASEPMLLKVDEWHVPYVDRRRTSSGQIEYSVEGQPICAGDALKISASCCAQVSYRVLDGSLAKAIAIYDRLVDSKPVHASPFEHQAKPSVSVVDPTRNFDGWVPHRVFIDGETVRG